MYDMKEKNMNEETRRRREVGQGTFCTFLRKNWRSERAVLLMPIIKMGAGRVEMGLVCEMEAHAHTHSQPCSAEKEASMLPITEVSRQVSLFAFWFRCDKKHKNEEAETSREHTEATVVCKKAS